MSDRLVTRRAAAFACLPLLAAGCMSQHSAPPAGLELARQRMSQAGLYRVELQPVEHVPPLQRMHSWGLAIADAEGRPVTGAEVRVDGGMPQHGHGLPTQPQVRADGVPGRYLLEGMKFSMTGWWELRLAIQGPPGRDAVTFNIVLPEGSP